MVITLKKDKGTEGPTDVHISRGSSNIVQRKKERGEDTITTSPGLLCIV